MDLMAASMPPALAISRTGLRPAALRRPLGAVLDIAKAGGSHLP